MKSVNGPYCVDVIELEFDIGIFSTLEFYGQFTRDLTITRGIFGPLNFIFLFLVILQNSGFKISSKIPLDTVENLKYVDLSKFCQ